VLSGYKVLFKTQLFKKSNGTFDVVLGTILRICRTFLVPIPIVLPKNWNPIWLELGTRVGFHLQNKYTELNI
jgi:hypothetical protein